MGILILLVLLNLMISAFNAWSCGRAWPESKRIGGWTRFMTWMGATMSAVGFTWCYLVIAVSFAVANETLTPEQAQVAFDLGYCPGKHAEAWLRAYRDGVKGAA